MGVQDRLFRKVALERLSSPEQIENLVSVVTPRAWLSLGPLLALLLATLAWSWFGRVQVTVSGRCILLNPTGLAEISSEVTGRVLGVDVESGEVITEGQVLVRVAQPQLLGDIERAEARLRELEAQERVLLAFNGRTEALNSQALDQARANITSQLSAVRERSRLLEERVRVQERLFADGLVTESTLVGTRQERVAAELEAQRLQNDLKEAELRRLEAEKAARLELASSRASVEQATRTLDDLRKAERAAARIVAPFPGRVVEIKTAAGSLVGQGSPVISLEREGDVSALEAVVYLSPADGKRVREEMLAQVSPATVRREEYGYMLGDVTRVAAYPATPRNMAMTLQNEELARLLAGDAPPIEVRASLRRAPGRTGYRWSSSDGPPLAPTSGTLGEAAIVVGERRPLSFVIPSLAREQDEGAG